MEKVLLITVTNSFEADMYDSLLSSCDITSYKRSRNGPGQLDLYLGQSNMGVEIYVSEDQYDEAKSILDDSNIDHDSVSISDENEGEIKKPYWIIPITIIIFVGYYFVKWQLL